MTIKPSLAAYQGSALSCQSNIPTVNTSRGKDEWQTDVRRQWPAVRKIVDLVLVVLPSPSGTVALSSVWGPNLNNRDSGVLESTSKKWFGVPQCVKIICFYWDWPLKLPIASLTEKSKCAKARLETTLNNWEIQQCAAMQNFGDRYRLASAVGEAMFTLQHVAIVVRVQQGKWGLFLTHGQPSWSAAMAPWPPGGRSINRDGGQIGECEKKGVGWRDLLSMDAKRLSFIIRAMFNVLPTPINFH